MDSHQLINQTSGQTEYWTPLEIVEAARSCMGSISLDPASCAAANERIKAKLFFDEKSNGMAQPWHGTVFLNHPFGRKEEPCKPGCSNTSCLKRGWHRTKLFYGNAAWINKLASEYNSGSVKEACCITFAATSEKWFEPLLAQPQCFLRGRTNYILPAGEPLKGVTKGSVITYFGIDKHKFRRWFKQFGAIKIVLDGTII